eukprot:CAMPEP_0171707252 /NCGR_PEP_ID=MMETSP0991-20121206/14259_1 /TAXON_ID=483369 /ORGANISM="non described non described, Strain CCMP2098" /LENGTH=57 /DNA_ID=CAMNT_0012297107 /DNA_START=105 /DNA_END=275 /DNA_ORIENTATION=-
MVAKVNFESLQSVKTSIRLCGSCADGIAAGRPTAMLTWDAPPGIAASALIISCARHG